MAGVFARHNISVKSIVQRGRSGAERVDQVVVTHRCRERDIREALEEALALDNVVLDTPSVIRVEGISDAASFSIAMGRWWIPWERGMRLIAPWRPRPASR